jgi:hypothetical protein
MMIMWRFYDEPVEMLQQRFRFLPQVFRWRGRCYEVRSVERSWTRPRRMRRYFQVRCGPSRFELYQDARTGTWHLRRAQLGRERPAGRRTVAPAWQTR